MTGTFDLLLAAESLVPPRTGVGNYTLNLYRELLLRLEIGRVVLMSGLRRIDQVPGAGGSRRADRCGAAGCRTRIPSAAIGGARPRTGAPWNGCGGIPADGRDNRAAQEPAPSAGGICRPAGCCPGAFATGCGGRFRLAQCGGIVRYGRLGERGAIRYLGYVAPNELPALYAGARGMAYVSLYEGYGLPPLEAMASGVPVLCSAGTSIEEVTAGCARLADPFDEDAIRDGLLALIEDEDGNRGLTERGLRRAAALTWVACAEGTVRSYRAALSGGHA